MEVDTGTAATISNKETYKRIIDYKPGPEHANADARLPLPIAPPTTPLPAETWKQM